MDTGFKKSGGEGGIRTLGTGVSPYNGSAIVDSHMMPCNPSYLQLHSGTKIHLM
jgi:hypothetical protein